MDLERMRVIYNCFIAGGFVVPVLDVLVGAIGGALDLGADADVGADASMDLDAGLDADADFDVDLDTDVDLDADMDLDADLDMDADLSAEAPAGAEGAHVSAAGRAHAPVIINLMTLSLTAVVFGAVGRLCLTRLPPAAGLAVSAASGLLAGWLLGRFVILPLKRNRSYAAGIREIKGQEGVVTLELRDDFVGTIRVHSASGSLVSYDARPAEGIARIPVGQAVTVVEVDPERMVCIAAPLEDKQES
ncbi:MULTISPECIES: NfeD family protein [Anaerotruncus]|uniref:NfeD family protein n=1 Tax=Anaerotruncus TaxID=244127 RepID=UPI0020827A07|nr:NfeD family protein [Anaerotruncus massiliensis (ex Togo et al. 2019)]GKH48398.1 hypothetical protein CE91St45_29600 [Oscillospiraceae bacterium]